MRVGELCKINFGKPVHIGSVFEIVAIADDHFTARWIGCHTSPRRVFYPGGWSEGGNEPFKVPLHMYDPLDPKAEQEYSEQWVEFQAKGEDE